MPQTTRRTVLKRSLALLGGLVLGGKISFAAQSSTDRVITVGASLPLGGPELFAEDGLRQLLAYRMWQDEVSAAGGLLGREVELIVYDDANDPAEAVSAYQKLIRDDRADLLLGNYGSGLARVTIPVVEEHEMPCIFPMAWQPQLWLQDHAWAVPLLPLATDVTHPLLDYHAANGARSAALIWAANGYARDLARSVRAGAAVRGIELVLEREYANDQELLAVLEEASAAEPDVLMGGNIGDRIPHVVGRMRELDLSFPAYGWFELDEPVLLEHREELEGMTGFGLWLPTMPFPDNRRFVSDFTFRWESEYPDEPIGLLIDHHSAAGYATTQLLQRAVEQVGTVDPESVRDALFAMDTETMFGAYRLSERGVQVGKEVPVVGYRKGLRETLWPLEIATV